LHDRTAQNLCYQTIGAGRVIVMLHGWAMHGGIFQPLVNELASEFHCLVVDLPGHGHAHAEPFDHASAKDSLCALAAQFPKAIWLGWSLGGTLACEVALATPAFVGGLIAIASSPCFVERPDWSHGMPMATFTQFADQLRVDWRAVVQRFLALEVLGSAHEREELRWLQSIVFARGEANPQALATGLAILQQTDLRSALRKLAIPSLWIGGRRDRLVPQAAIEAAASACGGEHLVLRHAGHAPFLHLAPQVAESIRRFALQLG
jgi:pimeloyl-[acyl-carrier protein] methyl ester esterase